MRVEFHPDALDEYEDAARYYAGCQDGLELQFRMRRVCDKLGRRIERSV